MVNSTDGPLPLAESRSAGNRPGCRYFGKELSCPTGLDPAPDERRDGRSPGLPINAFEPSSRRHPLRGLASDMLVRGSRLTVAGTAPVSHRLPS